MASCGRQIIVLFDGTSAKLGSRTNVERIKKHIVTSDGVHVIYRRGVNVVTDLPIIQTLAPTEIKRDVITVYDDIIGLAPSVDDEIHIFGYSRGAISARMLSYYIAHPETSIQEDLRGEDSDGQKMLPQRVKTLGIFDPVYGRFNVLSKLPGYELQPCVSEKIENYVEINAISEHRFLFPLRSGILQFQQYVNSLRENKLVIDSDSREFFRKRVELSSSGSKEKFILERIKSRKFIFMDGGHADIGNQGGNPSIGLQSFLIMMSICFEPAPQLRSLFCQKQLESLVSALRAETSPSPNSTVPKFKRFFRTARNFGYVYGQREELSKNEFATQHNIYQDWSAIELVNLFDS